MHDVAVRRQPSQKPEVMQGTDPPGRSRPPQPHRPQVETSGCEWVGHDNHVGLAVPQIRTELSDVSSDAASTAADDHDHPHRALLRSLPATSRADSRSPIQIETAYNVSTAIATMTVTVAAGARPNCHHRAANKALAHLRTPRSMNRNQ